MSACGRYGGLINGSIWLCGKYAKTSDANERRGVTHYLRLAWGSFDDASLPCPLVHTNHAPCGVRYTMGSPIALSHGPPFAGIFVSLILYGAMITQCAFYWKNYRFDPAWIRTYVCFLLFVDTLSTVLALTWIYGLLINSFGDLSKFTVSSWHPALGGLNGTFCQLFYAHRVRHLTDRAWVGAGIAVLSIACGLCAIGVGIAVVKVAEMSRFHEFDGIGSAWLILTCVVDIIITAIVSWNLRQSRSDFQRTKDVLSRIVLMTLSTCALTTACALTELIFFLTMPDTGLYITFSFIIPKLYCNSVLSSLNARKIHRVMMNSDSLPSVTDDYLEFNSTQRDTVRSFTPSQYKSSPDRVIQLSEEIQEPSAVCKKGPELDGRSSVNIAPG
ncbi:hypothetical protein PLICRDRAFT_49082 [Plicaturopsis crispa FD-325 SS-3]|nr:hypothetical protein PLICRDRAFT_49082 [Plicaturopsis crispa FD-325 SS-3]